jgi:hypothetical protein
MSFLTSWTKLRKSRIDQFALMNLLSPEHPTALDPNAPPPAAAPPRHQIVMEPQRTRSPLSPRPSLPLLPSTTASVSTATSSGGAARSRDTNRHAAAGGTFRDCSAASTEDGPAGGARGAPGEPGGGAVNGGVRGAPKGGGTIATDVERGQPHGAHAQLLQHL